MPREARAVIFDLDDTLYPYRRFVVSGFAAVAERLSVLHGVDSRAAFRLLVHSGMSGERGQEIQAALCALGLPLALLPGLVEILKSHRPALRLPRTSARVLRELRAGGWRLGVLTNGPKLTQARKVAALDLASHVDAIVYATEHGTGAGKPEMAPFVEAARRLGVPCRRVVFVGDDERCDVVGAMQAGMKAVRATAWSGNRRMSTAASHTVTRLSEVPRVAVALLEDTFERHVA